MSEGSDRVPVQHGHLAPHIGGSEACAIEEAVINRAEAAALLFNVSDIARSVERIEALLGGDDGEEEEADES
jgi:hypothetical protein